jgi:pimeloyl-ACP methyl ester carboxylesterase
MWWPVGAELAGVCTVVASDLPGHGDSPARDDHALDRPARDMAQLVARRELHRAPNVVWPATAAPLAATFADAYATHHVLTIDEPKSAVRDLDDVITAPAPPRGLATSACTAGPAETDDQGGRKFNISSRACWHLTAIGMTARSPTQAVTLRSAPSGADPHGRAAASVHATRQNPYGGSRCLQQIRWPQHTLGHASAGG